MRNTVILALAGAALGAPTQTIENRQFPGFGSSGSGTESGLGALASLFPGLGGESSGSSTGSGSGFPGLGDLPGLGGSGGSSSGTPSLPSFSDLPGLGGSGAEPSGTPSLPAPTALPSGAGIPSFKTGRDIEKRQFDLSSLTSGLGGSTGTSSGLSSLESLIPSIGGSSSSGGLGSLESLIPSMGGSSGTSGGLGALDSLIPSMGGSSGTSGGLGALESLIPSMSSSGSSSLGFKARRDAKEAEKRQFDLSSLTSALGGSSGTNSGLGALTSLIPSIGGSSGSSGLSIPGLSNIPSGSGISSLKAKRESLLGSGSITSNDVTDNAGCKELTFIFARGSDEMGNMGSVVGPPVATQLKSLTGDKVSVQGVTYAATAESNVALGANGGPVMAKLVKQALSQCPKTKVVLGGYSQGSMVVHNAANSLSADQVSGAVLFGDPFKAQSVGKLDSSKVKEYCATGDPVCLNGANVLAHLSYGSDAKEAAQFLIKAAGLSTSS
ncbi:hypothetical protein N7467_009888 [Penicillium canescens]|nr:hypothetical protein N7467_009888 [Penicillium canescens]